jgi:lipopolysaccharide/colanic/teichoic acid biosynthesis glycosyltransferase
VILCATARRAKWSSALKFAAVNVEIVTPELDKFQAISLGDFNGHRTLLVSARPLNIRDRALKRALDLAVAVPALILLAPVMLGISIAILVESGGPVLFRQRRVGHNSRMFNVLKFRSFDQLSNDPDGNRSASRGDNRMTKVGQFIRRTSLDELPQLLNVISGHMSIVGPRPHALGSTAEDDYFWNIDSRYFDRHAVKPGMTGLAQVRGFRGATIRRDDLTNRLQSDLEYLCEWTIWRDLKIILATFAVILHPNAF